MNATIPWARLLPVLLLSWLLTACSGVRLVPDYDAEAAKSITDTSAEVFAFYDKMIDAKAAAPRDKLAYASAKTDWGRIETRLRVLLVREQSRPLNTESERIAGTILDFWQKYRAQHLQKDDYAAVLLPIHRDRFQRLFTAALVAERAKRLADPDANPKLDSE